jgi:VanZ family protein
VTDRPRRTHWNRASLVALPLYWIALFTATHYPRVRIPGEIPHSDKVLHFTAFGLLALLYWQFAAALRPIGQRFVWPTAAILIAYAGLDEYLQQFFGRFTDLFDFFANTAGIVVVLAGLELRRRLRDRVGSRG